LAGRTLAPAALWRGAGLSGFWLLLAAAAAIWFSFWLLPPGTWSGPARGARLACRALSEGSPACRGVMWMAWFLLAAAVVIEFRWPSCASPNRRDPRISLTFGCHSEAVGGAILTNGSAVGTVGGAAVGGIIGHEVSKPKWWWHCDAPDRPGRYVAVAHRPDPAASGTDKVALPSGRADRHEV